MHTVLLFILPLVGEFIFCSTWNVTRWRVSREEGHRLYFRAVLFGAILFALFAAVHRVGERHSPYYSAAVGFVKEFLKPIAEDQKNASTLTDLAIICFLAMLSGWPLALLLNIGFRKGYWLCRAIRKDDLESFLLDAVDREMPIAITMDDRKVYVGFVVKGFDPELGRKCIELLPLISGYRDQQTHKVVFTTFYTEFYGRSDGNRTTPLPSPLGHLTAKDFITLVPTDRVASYRLFDAQAYSEFQKPKQEAQPNNTPPPAQQDA